MASKLILGGGIALVAGVSIQNLSFPKGCLVRFGTHAHITRQAASGIGKETALAFAEAGAKAIVFADINLQGA